MKIKFACNNDGQRKGDVRLVKRIASNCGTPKNDKHDMVIYWNNPSCLPHGPIAACYRKECKFVRHLKRRLPLRCGACSKEFKKGKELSDHIKQCKTAQLGKSILDNALKKCVPRTRVLKRRKKKRILLRRGK